MKLLSVVIPVYRSELIVEELVRQLVVAMQELNEIDYELILVEDYSPDNTWEAIIRECEKNAKVKGIKLSRNFGQHSAIYGGLCNAKGDWIVVMDCDLQDNPKEIINLFDKAKEGYDIVLAERNQRNDTWRKKMSSKLFYMVLGFLTGMEQNHKVGNFGIYHKKVIDSILTMNDYKKYFPAMINWIGFKKTNIEVEHSARHSGETTYKFSTLLSLALNTLISFSDRPLRLVTGLGAVISLLSVVAGIVLFARYLMGQIIVEGYASIMLSIWFLSGIIITVLGVMGLYIGKIYDQGKSRPVYVVEKMINHDN